MKLTVAWFEITEFCVSVLYDPCEAGLTYEL
jgi:hypothetical protein